MKINIFGKIGLIIGLLGAVAGFVPVMFFDPIIGGIIAVVMIFVFGFIYWIFFRHIVQQNRLLKTGISAEGVILKVSDTGVTINNNPQIKLLIEVYPQTGMPFQAETKLVISRLDVGYYKPGLKVNVRYEPADPSKIAVESLSGNGYAESRNYSPQDIKQMQEMLTRINDENTSLLAYGETARAIVLKYMPMGINVNGNNPAVTFELEVLPNSGRSFKATAKGVISEHSVGKFQPGEEIFVKFDPENTSKVAILHS